MRERTEKVQKGKVEWRREKVERTGKEQRKETERWSKTKDKKGRKTTKYEESNLVADIGDDKPQMSPDKKIFSQIVQPVLADDCVHSDWPTFAKMSGSTTFVN